jgi:hypothetical protein
VLLCLQCARTKVVVTQEAKEFTYPSRAGTNFKASLESRLAGFTSKSRKEKFIKNLISIGLRTAMTSGYKIIFYYIQISVYLVANLSEIYSIGNGLLSSKIIFVDRQQFRQHK